MPQKGQRTITLMQKDIPASLIAFAKSQDRSLANIIKLCIWTYFGNEEQVLISRDVLGQKEEDKEKGK